MLGQTDGVEWRGEAGGRGGGGGSFGVRGVYIMVVGLLLWIVGRVVDRLVLSSLPSPSYLLSGRLFFMCVCVCRCVDVYV